MITLFVSCGHCIVCPSLIYDFWLPLWYLVAVVLSVLPRLTTSGDAFGILWLLYCLSFLDLRLPIIPFCILWPLYCLSLLDLRLLIIPFVSCGPCIVFPSSIYDFWLPLWYLVAIVLSVFPRFCIICHSSIYDFWLPLWYLVAIVLSVLPRFTTYDYHFGILWPLYCLSVIDLRLLITPLVSCGHCIVCPSSIYDFWLPLWYLVAIVLSVLPQFTTSDYPFGIMWPLYCLSFLILRLLIIPFVSCGHCIVFPSSIVCPSSINDFWLPLWYLVAIVLSVIPWFCIVRHSLIYDFWLPLWYLVAIALSVLPRFTTYDYPFRILYCLSFLDLRLLITPLVSCGHFLSVLPRVTTSDYPFGILWLLHCLSFLDLRLLITPLVSCGHCIVCRSWIYDLWLPIWYLVAIVLSVLLRFTTSGYPFGILWPVYCLSFLDLRLLITLLVSCGHCIVCPSSINDFWLPLWYHVVIVLSVLPRFTISDYPFGVLWPLYCLSFLDLRLLITSLVSCGHCIVCPSSIYDFW